ncbi:hypothetical protein [Mycolicibacterium insubricum]|uniref:hypothetical protein n=1 Tax=Mycolicibacterium insubricum TaxID=444597 RepID=UPI0021F31A9D|nr:hypothetical protein [Mycolicibacterium insubricum]MCV7082587.1 hypothetical protein [Mycolicibacterium insubricum]
MLGALAIIIAVIILAQFKGNQGEQGGNRSTVTQTETPPPQTSEPAPAHPSGWTTGHPEQGSTLLLATAVPLLHPGTDEIAT